MYVWVCYHRIYVLLSMNISGNTHSVIEHLRCLSFFQAQSCVSSMSMYVDRNLSSLFSSHGIIEAYTYYMLHDLTHLKPLQLEGLSMLYLLTLVSGMCNSHRVTSFFCLIMLYMQRDIFVTHQSTDLQCWCLRPRTFAPLGYNFLHPVQCDGGLCSRIVMVSPMLRLDYLTIGWFWWMKLLFYIF